MRSSCAAFFLLSILICVTGEARARDRKTSQRAEKAFHRALRLQAEQKLDAAAEALTTSTSLAPGNPTYATARELIRQQRVTKHIDEGNRLMGYGQRIEAAAEFQQALALDSTSNYAIQRLQETGLIPITEEPTFTSIVPSTFSPEPQIEPKPGKQSFDFRGGSRDLIQTVAKAFGLTVTFDDAVASRPVRFKLSNVDFDVAMSAAQKVTHTFYVPMSSTEILVASDTQDSRRRLERMSLRTFYIGEASTAQELQEYVNLLRTMLDVRYISPAPQTSSLTVRAPARILDAAEAMFRNLGAARAEVMIDVRAFELSETRARQLGVDLPLQFTVFNVNTEAGQFTNRPDLQDLIDRLTAGGDLSAADAAALAGLLTAAQNANSPLLQPFATFGGGRTLSGVAIPPVTVRLNMNQSFSKSLQHALLRAQQGRAATFRVGTRFPVLTSAFSPLVNLPIPDRARRDQVLQPIPPSFTYEDLGITLKATPQVRAADQVTLQFELAIKALGTAALNGVPVISNREYTGTISLKHGETSIIAGAITQSEQTSMRGLPLLSQIPGLTYATSSESKDLTNSQILLVLTPYIIRSGRLPSESLERFLEGF